MCCCLRIKLHYTSSHNHGNQKWAPPIVVTFQIFHDCGKEGKSSKNKTNTCLIQAVKLRAPARFAVSLSCVSWDFLKKAAELERKNFCAKPRKGTSASMQVPVHHLSFTSKWSPNQAKSTVSKIDGNQQKSLVFPSFCLITSNCLKPKKTNLCNKGRQVTG